jgi:phenylacetate-CoA ligase
MSRHASARQELEPIEVASRDELCALQLDRLKWSVRHAYDNVPHYRDAFDAVGVHPDEIRDLSDLGRFPFTVKDDLRKNYPFGMFAVPRREIARIHATSGTTGRPAVVGYTRRDIETWARLIARCIRAAGGRPSDTVHIAYGYGLFTGGLGAHYGAEHLGCTVIPMSGGQTERQVKLIQDFQPDIIMVTPSYMLALGDEFRRQGVDPRSTSLSIGMHGAEPWSEAMRQEIEDTFGIEAVDIYGLAEIIGPGVANECLETKDGLHVWEDHFYPEIIDPQTGRVLPDGSYGELVLTSLTKEAQPMVRYRTRDLTRLIPGTARTMRRIERINGRSDDMLIVHGVNIFPSQIEELVLADKRLSPHYQLELHRQGHLDRLDVVVEGRNGAATDVEQAQSCARDLAHHVKSMIGVTVHARVVAEGSIARSNGKAKRVVDFRTVE